jgi:hypothetical protein
MELTFMEHTSVEEELSITEERLAAKLGNKIDCCHRIKNIVVQLQLEQQIRE